MTARFQLDGCYELVISGLSATAGMTPQVRFTIIKRIIQSPDGGTWGTIPAGTTVKIDGVPVELQETAEVRTEVGNWTILQNRYPLTTATTSTSSGAEFATMVWNPQPEERVVFEATLKPSEARALASQMLSAATEAKGA